jgi:peptidoglycan/xylan/chitin deacetylase (PgdA/CDA1 family)
MRFIINKRINKKIILKKIIFHSISIISYLFPTKLLIHLSRVRTVFLFYHLISNNAPIHIKNLYSVRTEKKFRNDLKFLLKHFQYTTEIIRHNSSKKNYFHLSFDDGLKECFEIIEPILNENQIKAVFFINSGFIDNKDLFYKYKVSIIIEKLKTEKINKQNISHLSEILECKTKLKTVIQSVQTINFKNKYKLDRISEYLKINFIDYLKQYEPYLTTNQIIKLKEKGHKIGAHSINHPEYFEIIEEEQIKQTTESLNEIKQQFDSEDNLFAFPFTDNLIKISFFEKINRNFKNIYTFGTAGIKYDQIKNNIQRIPVEMFNKSAKTTIKTQYILYILKKIFNRHLIKRK